MTTVLITTSGTGSRLGELTKNTNKALVKINGKPAIDYIFQNYPEDTEFVVTLGYLGDQVRDYLTQHYPKRTFTFVTVDTYEGPGTSLGYSMLAAENKLQKPFIFHCCDTIVTGDLPSPTHNWAAGYKIEDATQYRTLNIQGTKVKSINDKGAPNFDYIHIGLVGLKDFAHFWKTLRDLYTSNPEDQTLNDTFVINKMLEDGADFDFTAVNNWFDTGNPQALERTKQALSAL